LDTETAWGPCEELWNSVIAQYEGVCHVYLSEEPGMGYYVNSDVKRVYFSERYLLNLYGEVVPEGWYASYPTKPNQLTEHEYFESLEELLHYCAEITGKCFANLEELRAYFEDAFDNNAHVCVGIHEFEDAYEEHE